MKTTGLFRLLAGSTVLGLLLMAVAVFGSAPASAQQSYVLQGRVLSYNKGAISGAQIHLYAMPQHTLAGQTTTDGEGNFTIDTGPGTFAIDAEASGYSTDEQTVFVTSYDSGILFLLREAAPEKPAALVATISGKVFSADNVPLGGMNIAVYDRQQGDSSQPRPIINATITDVNGNYSIQVPAGTVWLSLATQAVWGYDYTPIAINAGQSIGDIIFVAQVRVLPRVLFPTETPVAVATAVPTATPVSDVGPIVGMPSTGGPAADFSGLLVALLALLGAGVALRAFASRKPSQDNQSTKIGF